MKYITKVILKNFQSHKNTIVEFDGALNVIVGASDSGKTSIIRAIKWALYNDPSGDYFIREGESESSVTIFFSDKTKIKRYRSKSKNIYFIYDKDDKEIKYEGFGVSVPEEVMNLTGIKKILLDKDTSKSINISDQLEGAFLLSEKNSIKANSIGYLVGVDVIDDALRETLKDTRNLSNRQKSIDEDIDKLEDNLLEYKYLEDLDRKIKSIEKINQKIIDKNKALNLYNLILEKNIFVKKEKKKIEYYLKRLGNIEKLESSIYKFEIKCNRINILSNYNTNFKNIKQTQRNNINLLESLKNIDDLDFILKKIKNLQEDHSKLSKIKIKFVNIREEKNKTNIKLNKLINLKTIESNIFKIEEKLTGLKSLTILKTSKEKVLKSLEIGNNYFSRLKNVDLSMKKYSILEEKIKILNIFIKYNNKYLENKEEDKKYKKHLVEKENIIDKMLAEYKKILLSQKTCPFCFSHIDNNKAEYIVKQYK